MGKAQPLDARMRTRGGSARWAIRGGDGLASVDGCPSIVVGTYPQGVRQVYRVRFSDRRSTECFTEHLSRTHHRAWPAPRVISTERLIVMLEKARHRNRLWIDLHNGAFRRPEALPVGPWLLGALLGDGTLSGTALRFRRVGRSARASASAHRRIDRPSPTPARTIIGSSTATAAMFEGSPAADRTRSAARSRRSGCWEGTVNPSSFRGDTSRPAREARLGVLRGLLDIDGSVERWGSVRLSTAREELANDVARIGALAGRHVFIGHKQQQFRSANGVPRPGKRTWVCHISRPEPRSCSCCRKADSPAGALAAAEAADLRRHRAVARGAMPVRRGQSRRPALHHRRRRRHPHDGLPLNISEHVALVTKQPVAVFSMEMRASQLALQMIGSVGRLDRRMLRTGRSRPTTRRSWPARWAVCTRRRS